MSTLEQIDLQSIYPSIQDEIYLIDEDRSPMEVTIGKKRKVSYVYNGKSETLQVRGQGEEMETDF